MEFKNYQASETSRVTEEKKAKADSISWILSSVNQGEIICDYLSIISNYLFFQRLFELFVDYLSQNVRSSLNTPRLPAPGVAKDPPTTVDPGPIKGCGRIRGGGASGSLDPLVQGPYCGNNFLLLTEFC